MSVYRGYEGAHVNVCFVQKADSCSAAKSIERSDDFIDQRLTDETPKPLSGHQNQIIGGISGESAKPCYNRSRIRHVRYGDHRAADRYCAVLLQHAREQIEFASFWNHNRSAGQGICHLSSRRKIVTPPLFARKIERDGDQAWRRRVR